MAAVAEKVAFPPAHMVSDGLAVILTLTGNDELTSMVMALDAAGEPVTHGPFEDNIQVIISPLFNPVVV